MGKTANTLMRISALMALTLVLGGCAYEPQPRPIAYIPVPCPPPGSQAVTPEGQPVIVAPAQDGTPAAQCFITAPIYPVYPMYPDYPPYAGYYRGGLWLGGHGRWR